MKQINKISRLTGELEKIFRLLNEDFFGGELPTPIITVTPTSRAYGHYTPYDSWSVKDSGAREINIASGTLYRGLELTITTLLHEMCHMRNDCILHIVDTSRKGTYHNKHFKQTAEAHGLICTRTEKYGWSRTEPSDMLLDWLLLHDELREIEMCRSNPAYTALGVGSHSSNSNGLKITGANPNSHSRKYTCSCCGNSVRATKAVNVICGDCMQKMIES